MSDDLTAPLGLLETPAAVPTESVRTNGATSAHKEVSTAADWPHRVWSALRLDPRLALQVGVAAAVLLAVVGVALVLSGPTTYTSKAVMLIDDPLKLATAGDEGQVLKLDALRLKYSALISTSAIAGPVARKLSLPEGAVAGAVVGVVPLDSLLMDVEATASTARGAQVLAQTTADAVTTYVHNEDVNFNIPTSDRFTLTTIDPAGVPTASGPSKVHALTLGLGLGVLGFLLGFCGSQFTRHRELLG